MWVSAQIRGAKCVIKVHLCYERLYVSTGYTLDPANSVL
jgi:hypothetical protein